MLHVTEVTKGLLELGGILSVGEEEIRGQKRALDSDDEPEQSRKASKSAHSDDNDEPEPPSLPF